MNNIIIVSGYWYEEDKYALCRAIEGWQWAQTQKRVKDPWVICEQDYPTHEP